jgi:hypothetical protein
MSAIFCFYYDAQSLEDTSSCETVILSYTITSVLPLQKVKHSMFLRICKALRFLRMPIGFSQVEHYKRALWLGEHGLSRVAQGILTTEQAFILFCQDVRGGFLTGSVLPADPNPLWKLLRHPEGLEWDVPLGP